MKNVRDFFHYTFIPKEENDFRAKPLHLNFLTFYLFMALFFTFFFKYSSVQFPNILGFATDITVNKLLDLTNKERTNNNLPLLSYNEKLSLAAKKKALDMFNKNYWAHFSPEGTTPWDFILSSEYQYEFAGENLAKNFMFSQGVIDAWMNSKTHRENILKRDYSEIGFAVVNGVLNGEQTTLVVQMFGKSYNSSFSQVQNMNIQKEKPTNENVLAQQTNKPLINLSKFAFNLNTMFILFLLLTLGIDIYFAARMKIVKVGGKNLAHFIFIGFMLLGLLVLVKGSII
ncbi:MAG: hypothetical protein HYW86_01320 [Candidatus Roizmanbacteria bacterium]|nr:MAG: hypothetical protein HYW86_01320 [Candidatus Roizmanbacteria bacterium]